MIIINKYKVCVYAISKNEEKFVERWLESMCEADEIYVLDTGSTDNTINLLKKNKKVHIKQKNISPWRFDVARNESLKLVPKDCDICVCTDIDEVFLEGWRKELENIWQENTTRVAYNYNWRLNENNKPLVNFYIEKIHSRDGYEWYHPVHEILKCNIKEEKITTDKITLNHYPDITKSRSSYLKLLELSVKEDPYDDRNMHYLGREYMYYKEWNKAIDTLIKHLSLEKATWKDERCASMRFIARCYQNLGRMEKARMWLDKAINEAPYLRDPYIERVILEYNEQNWQEAVDYGKRALKIKEHPKTYINEVFSWDNTIYDILSICYYYLGRYEESLHNLGLAIEMNPDDERLKNNLKIIKENYK